MSFLANAKLQSESDSPGKRHERRCRAIRHTRSEIGPRQGDRGSSVTCCYYGDLGEAVDAAVAAITLSEQESTSMVRHPWARSRRAKEPQRKAKETLLCLVRELRAQDMSWAEVARELNDRGMPTLAGKGQWRDEDVARLLSKE